MLKEKKKRDQNCGINHLPNSAGNVTPDYLEVLGCFQTGKTSSFYLRFQPRFVLTALHRRSKALNHPPSHNCCCCVWNLLFILCTSVLFRMLETCLCATGAPWEKVSFILFAETMVMDLPRGDSVTGRYSLQLIGMNHGNSMKWSNVLLTEFAYIVVLSWWRFEGNKMWLQDVYCLFYHCSWGLM